MEKKNLVLKNKVFSSESDFNRYYFQFFELKKHILFTNKTILDIGCGKGDFLIICSLFENASNCIGLDSFEGKGSEKNSLEIFKQNMEALNLNNVNYIKSDIFKHDFEEIQFDIITANYSLHHIIETTENISRSQELLNKLVILFNKIYKLLKPKGVLLITEISKYNLSRYFPIHGKIFGFDNINWKTKHLPSEYIIGLKKTKFKNIRIIYPIPYLIKKYKFIRFKKFLINPISNFFFSSIYYIIARV